MVLKGIFKDMQGLAGKKMLTVRDSFSCAWNMLAGSVFMRIVGKVISSPFLIDIILIKEYSCQVKEAISITPLSCASSEVI
jgi:hypothetical protein